MPVEYCWPRIWKELRENCVQAGKECIWQQMKQHSIKAHGKRKFVAPTDSQHHLPVAPNLLNRKFQPAQPHADWARDITYIQIDKGWLYQEAVIDCTVAR